MCHNLKMQRLVRWYMFSREGHSASASSSCILMLANKVNITCQWSLKRGYFDTVANFLKCKSGAYYPVIIRNSISLTRNQQGKHVMSSSSICTRRKSCGNLHYKQDIIGGTHKFSRDNCPVSKELKIIQNNQGLQVLNEPSAMWHQPSWMLQSFFLRQVE